jgi:hypothetical protein
VGDSRDEIGYMTSEIEAKMIFSAHVVGVLLDQDSDGPLNDRDKIANQSPVESRKNEVNPATKYKSDRRRLGL